MPTLDPSLSEETSPETSLRLFQTKRSAAPLEGDSFTLETSIGKARVVSQISELDRPAWIRSFGHSSYDHRYYELTQAALKDQFCHRYLILSDQRGRTRAIQPFFMVNQDLLGGTSGVIRSIAAGLRQYLPAVLSTRVLMVGCSAAEGCLSQDVLRNDRDWVVLALREALQPVAKRLGASLIVFKDFSSSYRNQFRNLSQKDYVRIPSMPATRIRLDFASFEEYLQKRITEKTRKNLLRKFRKVEKLTPLTMEVRRDIRDVKDEILRLYQQVFRRASYRFEEITGNYFAALCRDMAERAYFFIWRLKGRAVAFCSCLGHEGVLRDNYLGLDYEVALDYHLYFVTWRDVIKWCLTHGFHTYQSAPLNYEPKYHLRQVLAPLDLYVRSTAVWLNPVLRKVLTFLEPTRHDPIIRRFSNAHEVW